MSSTSNRDMTVRCRETSSYQMVEASSVLCSGGRLDSALLGPEKLIKQCRRGGRYFTHYTKRLLIRESPRLSKARPDMPLGVMNLTSFSRSSGTMVFVRNRKNGGRPRR